MDHSHPPQSTNCAGWCWPIHWTKKKILAIVLITLLVVGIGTLVDIFKLVAAKRDIYSYTLVQMHNEDKTQLIRALQCVSGRNEMGLNLHSRRRPCLMDALEHEQSFESMMALGLLVKEWLEEHPLDLSLRFKALVAIEFTKEQYQEHRSEMIKGFDRALALCEASFVGQGVLRCQDWFDDLDANYKTYVASMNKLRNSLM